MSLQALASTLVGPISNLLSEVVTDRDQRDRLAHDLATLSARHAHSERLGQMDVNKAEAAHRTVFVAGWRPFIGWVCGTGMAFNYLIAPIANATLSIWLGAAAAQIEPLSLGEMLPVLGGMLGLGGLRSWEKSKGLTK